MEKHELEEIWERCNKATKGPWQSFVEGRDHISGSSFIMTGLPDDRTTDIELIGATNDDQDFVAHAREDIPTLLSEITRLQKNKRQQTRLKRTRWNRI